MTGAVFPSGVDPIHEYPDPGKGAFTTDTAQKTSKTAKKKLKSPQFLPPSSNEISFDSFPTESAKKSANSSNGSENGGRGCTYEIVSKENPETGMMEYSMVWIEITKKGDPKCFLGYFEFTPSGDGKPSAPAKAITDLIQAAETQDVSGNFKKSSAQTTLNFEPVPAKGKTKAHANAVLTRGKEKVTLDPTTSNDLDEKIQALHNAMKRMKIIEQTGANFSPRDKMGDANNGQKKETRDITTEKIDSDSLNTYLNRVQQDKSSKIHLHPVTTLKDLNSDKEKFKTDSPQFIPVEVGASHVYLYKNGKELYYYDPKKTEIKSQSDETMNYLKNTICAKDSTDIGKALHQFAYNNGIKQLHAPKATHAGTHSPQQMGIQWFAHLSGLHDITSANAFFSSTPDKITVPESASGSDLSIAEQSDKPNKATAATAAEPSQAALKPKRNITAETFFEGVEPPEGSAHPDLKHKQAWLAMLLSILRKEHGNKITPKHVRLFRDKTTVGVDPLSKSKKNKITWSDLHTGYFSSLHKAYSGEGVTSNKNDRAFHAQLLNNLANSDELCEEFCQKANLHKPPIPVADPAKAIEPVFAEDLYDIL